MIDAETAVTLASELMGAAAQLAPVPARLPKQVDPALLSFVLAPTAALFAFVWGTLWGSFGNVVIYRWPRGMSLSHPRSRCGSCETPIAWYDNIPLLTYILLRGRCRHCKAGYSPRYLLVEFVSGVLSFAVWMRWARTPLLEGAGLEAVVVAGILWAVSWAMLILIFIDLEHFLIPDLLVLPPALGGLVLAVVQPELLGVAWAEALAAGVAGYGGVWGIRAFYRWWRGFEAIGMGDAKLLMAVGLLFGWPGLGWVVFGGSVQGLLVALPTLLRGRSLTEHSVEELHGDDPTLGHVEEDAWIGAARVPFGPFLGLAVLEWILVRREIKAGYAAFDALLYELLAPVYAFFESIG